MSVLLEPLNGIGLGVDVMCVYGAFVFEYFLNLKSLHCAVVRNIDLKDQVVLFRPVYEFS